MLVFNLLGKRKSSIVGRTVGWRDSRCFKRPAEHLECVDVAFIEVDMFRVGVDREKLQQAIKISLERPGTSLMLRRTSLRVSKEI